LDPFLKSTGLDCAKDSAAYKKLLPLPINQLDNAAHRHSLGGYSSVNLGLKNFNLFLRGAFEQIL